MRLMLLALVCAILSGCAMFQDETLDEVVAGELSKAQKAKILRQHYEAGEKYYKDGKLALAASEYRAMLDLKPEEESALYRLGNIAFKEGNFDKSAEFFTRTIAANPRNAKAHYNLASIRLMQSQNHFQYYTALAGKGEDISRVSALLGDIDTFNAPPETDKEQSSLDQISGALKNR